MDGLFSSWPALTSDEPLKVLPPSTMVSGQATGGPGPVMGQPQFLLHNLWQILMNHHHLLPLWRWPFRRRARRRWQAETSRWCRLKLMARWTLLLLASFNFWWTPGGLTTLDDGVWSSDRGPDQRWGQPQFLLQNLWQIRVNQHHLLPLWARWRSYSRCDRPWPVGAGRVVSRLLIKVAFSTFSCRIFSGKWHRRHNGLEIGKNLPDPILNGLLVPAEGPWPWLQGTGRRPGAWAGDQRPGPAMGQPQFVLQNLGQIRKFPLWRWPFQQRTLRPRPQSWSQPSFNLFYLWKVPMFW